MSLEPDYQPVSEGARQTAWSATGRGAIHRLESFWNVLRYSSAYLSVVTVIEVVIAMVVLSVPPNVAPVILGLVTFAVYANDRIADADDDAVSKPDQVAFVRRHENVLYVLAAGAYGLAVALSVLAGPAALALTLLPGVFWVLYAADWVPDVTTRIRRLKDVLVLNTTVVAFAWAVSLTFLPLAVAGQAPTPLAGIVFAYFFLRSFVDTELPNVDDRHSDAAAGVRTLPVVFGVETTRRFLVGVDVLTLGLVAVGVVTGLFSDLVAVALGIGVVYSTVTTIAVVGHDEVGDWTTIAPEIEYVVVAVALLPAVIAL
ncbi:MAG: UbiA family prenyltransferase [Halanaeroarchaeum sp.]